MYVAARLMNRCQQNDESLQEYKYEFSALFQAVSKKNPSKIIDPLERIM